MHGHQDARTAKSVQSRQRHYGKIYEGGGVVIEAILRACEIILICVAAFIVGYVLFCAVCAAVNKIKKNRPKKFIKDNEQKAVPCHCGRRANIEHRFGEFYHIGCPCCPIGFTDENIPKLVKMWNDVQSIKAGDYVDTGLFKGRVQSISHGVASVYADVYNTSVEVPLQYIKKIKSSSAKVV